ncbi:MAG: hypothetical protein CFE28_06325 [Alphaproteobacteria bacterium PA2]|nr:MAG: hypothetical protein CFE28_06325 [Alphaproteobacteria bacterium PA2]
MPLREELIGLIETDRETARSLLLDLTSALPDSMEAWELLAVSYLRTLEYPDAIRAYRRLLSLAPDHRTGLNNLAFATLANGDNLAARTAYQQAFAATSSVNAANHLANVEHRLGNLERAIEIYGRVLAQASAESTERLASNRGLMLALRDAGRPQEADRPARVLLDAYAAAPVRTSSWLAERAQSHTFHEWLMLADKGRLADLMRRGLSALPGALRFPETFILPGERKALEARAAAGTDGALFIVKPNNGSGGQGISVTADLASAANRTDTVVQRYVDRPYLIDGRKGHLRIYVLITSADPLRAYIYRDGIVRFAPEPYDPRPERLGDISMHVTNTALHASHPDLKISQDPDRDDEGMIWSLAGFFRRMDQDGGDSQAVFREISDLACGFLKILRQDGFFQRWSDAGPRRAFPPKVFGMDVLVDEDGHPWLLEIQASPAVTGAPLVNRVNAGLIRTIFDMSVGVLGSETEPALRSADLEARELMLETTNQGQFERLTIDPA